MVCHYGLPYDQWLSAPHPRFGFVYPVP
eukprot:COSAG01_NODE_72506_length_252_cov_12.333333_1_plen_27_part_01